MTELEYNEEDYRDLQIGPMTVLFGYQNGKYPQGNSLLVSGRNETVIIDPCLGVVPRKDRLPAIDRVLHSHVHEDHLSANYLFQTVPWHSHESDLLGLHSIEGLMDIYGLEEPVYSSFKEVILNDFNFVPNPSATGFEDGDVFDLGGVTIEVLHTPGHTRGHCCFIVAWEGSEDRLVYLGDIELTGFGPYYGDAWSDLEDFEQSLDLLRKVDARWWLTFHHKGLYESRDDFLPALEKFSAVIESRETRLLEYLAEPRSLEDIVRHRFVYRPGNEGVIIDYTERRSMQRHLERLIRAGRVSESSVGEYQINT